jgi:hypothetical protein
MAKDYGEMEREFIAGLKDDTGKDLAEWMAAIAAQRFTDKNDAIDWLRRQGFIFNWASWLERIHANGGRPIYADKPALAPRIKRSGEGQGGGNGKVLDASTPSNKATTIGHSPTAGPSPLSGGAFAAEPAAPTRTAPDDPHLEALIAAAKGYQPLYRMLAAHILQALPGARIAAAAGYISIGCPREFAAIESGPRGLRLALDLGDVPFAAPLQPSRLAAPPKRLSHMLVLDDARQVDAALMQLLKSASARVNPE